MTAKIELGAISRGAVAYYIGSVRDQSPRVRRPYQDLLRTGVNRRGVVGAYLRLVVDKFIMVETCARSVGEWYRTVFDNFADE